MEKGNNLIGIKEDEVQIAGDKVDGKFIPAPPPRITMSIHELTKPTRSNEEDTTSEPEKKPLVPRLTDV